MTVTKKTNGSFNLNKFHPELPVNPMFTSKYYEHLIGPRSNYSCNCSRLPTFLYIDVPDLLNGEYNLKDALFKKNDTPKPLPSEMDFEDGDNSMSEVD